VFPDFTVHTQYMFDLKWLVFVNGKAIAR
jgi:hypothetical protein